MKNYFYKIGDYLLNQLEADEYLKIDCLGEKSQFIRFNQSLIRQIGTVEDIEIVISYIFNNRSSSVSTTLTGEFDKDQILIYNIFSSLKKKTALLPMNPFIVLPSKGNSSEQEIDGDLLDQHDAINVLLPPMKEMNLTGFWASGQIFTGHMNSFGQKNWFASDSFSLDYSLIGNDERMVKEIYAGTDWNQDEYANSLKQAMDKFEHLNKEAIKIKPGQYRTYIGPAGVADLIDMFSWRAISESSIQKNDSALLKMKRDGKNLSSCFTLKEDFSKGSVPNFNSEGEIVADQLPLIVSGALKNTLISSKTAKEYQLKSNFAEPDEWLRAPSMEPGSIDENEILHNLGTGLYLSNLHYLNWSDHINGRITGMTRYACYWVDNGKIIAPIENMRFDDLLYNIFGDNLEDATNKSYFQPNVSTYRGRSFGGTWCPGILLKNFSLTI